jgi:hypothetical protein
LPECRIVFVSQFGQNFAVQVETRGFQTVYELAIGKSGLAACGVNTHNPKRAIIALLVFPPDIGELQTPLHRFLGCAIEFALG